uniref:Acrosin n=1 Tax=Catharus ustulatus TaxID=91951 RepID=A0A8C3V2C6_CATUS
CAGTDGSAGAARAAGPGLARGGHLGQLQVSGPRLWEGAQGHSGRSRAEPGGQMSLGVLWPCCPRNGTWHMCTGVLLSPQWVLTVAHCFMSPEHGQVPRSQHHVPLAYLTHPARNDIALLELDQPVECSDYIQLGCVPDASWTPWGHRLDTLGTRAGCWGLIPMVLGPGLTLQEAKVHLMDTELCNSSRWYAGAVRADDLCAGYPHGGIDTCQGDSGSPLVCKDNGADSFWLVGMYSWGRGCDRARHPGIYTDTQYFHNWILHHTGLTRGCSVPAAPRAHPSLRSRLLLK